MQVDYAAHEKTPILRGIATPYDTLQNQGVEDRGLEQPPKTSGNAPIIAQGGAESGAVVAGNDPTDSDLQAVVEQWEDLPEATKDRIAAMLRAADGKG